MRPMTLMERPSTPSRGDREGRGKEKVMDVVRRRVARDESSSQEPHPCLEPCGIGEGLSVKVNVNLGTSKDRADLEEELEKARVALRYGADTIMDLSTGGDIDAIRGRILKEAPSPWHCAHLPDWAAGRPGKRRGGHGRGRHLQWHRAPRQGRRGLHDRALRDHPGERGRLTARAHHRRGLPRRLVPGGLDPAQREGEPALPELDYLLEMAATSSP